jgi:hypothetical protein
MRHRVVRFLRLLPKVVLRRPVTGFFYELRVLPVGHRMQRDVKSWQFHWEWFPAVGVEIASAR